MLAFAARNYGKQQTLSARTPSLEVPKVLTMAKIISDQVTLTVTTTGSPDMDNPIMNMKLCVQTQHTYIPVAQNAVLQNVLHITIKSSYQFKIFCVHTSLFI